MSTGRRDRESPDGPARGEAWLDVESIGETVREALLVLDARLRVKRANRAFYRIFRVSAQDTEGRVLYDLGDGQWDIPRLRTLLEEILPEATSFDDYEVAHDFPGIGRKVMLLNARRLHRAGTALILLAIEDVTERRRAEEDKREIEARFTSLVKNIKDHSIFTLDPAGRVTSWNVAAEHVLGYSEAEVLGRHFAFIFTPEDCAQGLPEAELRAAREQGRGEDERWHLRKGGERFWASGIVSALHDTDGRLTGFSKILRDMTAWKLAEQDLRASEERQRRMLDVDGVGVLIFDNSGTVIHANDAFLRMTGYARAEVAARALTWRTMTPPEHVAESERQMRLFGETGRVGPYEKEYFRKDRSRSWMHVAGASLGDGTIVEYCVDVDERKRAEAALRASEEALAADLANAELLRRLAERLVGEEHAATIHDRILATTVAVARAAAATIQIYDPQTETLQLLASRHCSRTIAESFHRVDAGSRTARGIAMHAGRRAFLDVPAQAGDVGCRLLLDAGLRSALALPLVSRTGTPLGMLNALWRETRHRPTDRELRFLELVARQAADLIEQSRAREELRESEERYRTLFESIDEGFCVFEMIYDDAGRPADYRFLEVNPAFERHTGLADALGKTIRALVPEHEQKWFEMYARVAQTGEPVRIEARAKGLGRWYDLYAFRTGDAGRRTVAALFSDITARKRTEQALRDREARLRESERRKDAFLAVLAHELRNPLAPLRTGLDLVQALRGDAGACEAPLRIMDRQINHLVRLVDDLLDVSRISRGKVQLRKEPLDLAEIIHAALDMSGSRVRRGDGRLGVELPSQPLPVEGDRVRLVQVVANLLDNAAKFSAEDGHIALCVVPRGEHVEIRVRDDGQGIPRDRLDAIFEMFSQVEPGRGGGLGIGLGLVRSLVAMHGGSVRADSAGPGCGATFTVSLPLCPAARQQATPRKATAGTFLPPDCRVLVVDDNRDIAESLGQLLTLLQAEVRVAYDGAEALRVCADWSPSHVLMDLGMPGMDGYEAARRLCAEHPERAFRLIAVTGWGQDADRRRTRAAGFDAHLVKPVGVAELTAVLAG